MSYTYPPEYSRKGIEDQVSILRQHFPKLKAPSLADSQSLPGGAEGYFAIPQWQKIGKTYTKAVERILDILGDTRDFVNWREGKLGPDYLRRLEGVDEKLAQFADGDFLIVPAQFGMKHRGESVRSVRKETGEVPFGAFEVACMLLTHPERLTKWEDLASDCPGDEYSFNGDGRFGRAPCFVFDGDELGLVAIDVDDANGRYGSSSGLLPQFAKFDSRHLDPSVPLILELGGKRYEIQARELP